MCGIGGELLASQTSNIQALKHPLPAVLHAKSFLPTASFSIRKPHSVPRGHWTAVSNVMKLSLRGLGPLTMP